MSNLKLTQIWIYPIKSLGGISLSSAQVMGKGLQYDRRWMLIDENGVAMTQRVFPKMALFKLSIQDHQMAIAYGHEILKVDLKNRPTAGTMPVNIAGCRFPCSRLQALHRVTLYVASGCSNRMVKPSK